MILTKHDSIRIKGVACAVPKNIDYIKDHYERFGKEAVDNFIRMTGVKERHISFEKQTASDFAFIAARHLINQKNINIDEIGALIFVTQTPDYLLPATACVLAMRLQLPTDCIVFDINLGCSGYVYGLNVLASLMSCSNINKALLLVGDTSTVGISPEDRSAYMLFGDGGAATLLEKESESQKSLIGSFRTDGTGFKSIIVPAGSNRNLNASKARIKWGDGNIRSDYDLYMNGTDVFSFTISEVPKIINGFMDYTQTNTDYYDAFVLHQANEYILRQVIKKCKIPTNKLPLSIDRYGNTSVTSIPITLCDAYGDTRDNEMQTLLCGFGVGLSWGVISAKICSNDILPIIETDNYFDAGEVSHD